MLIHKYGLNNVELTEPVLENALQKEKEYLKSIKIDRLLAGFRETAGLSKIADRYPGGWEDAEIAGHTLGHYMTALAQLFDATRDNDVRNRLLNLLLGLAECQAGNGYLFAANEEIFDRVEKGEEAWVPWYTMHKIMAGLLAVYRYAKLDQALEIVGKLGEWVYYRTQNWSEETRAKVLSVEYGGMNDCLYDLYRETQFRQFLETAEKFDEKELYRDVTEGKDVLSGKHANTMIPKFVGAINRYLAVQDLINNPGVSEKPDLGETEKAYLDAAKAFFDMVQKDHTYVTGGNSENEFFREPRSLAAHRSRCNCETCNTYNMMKLAERLYRVTGESRYMDFYERAYFNAILGSQNPETGMTTYFQPMEAGYFKVFGKPYENFWCCTGTGMENFTKLNGNIYHTEEKKVYVNLYVASVLHEMDLDVDITQKTSLQSFETAEFSILAIGRPKFTLCFRIPEWSAEEPKISINGAAAMGKKENGYFCVEREWKSGDKVSVRFYPEIRVNRLPDADSVAAFSYGPFALAADLGNEDMRTETTGVNVTVPTKTIAVREVILITQDSVQNWLNNCRNNVEMGDKLTFFLNGTDTDQELVFTPYYLHYNDRYGIYFEFLSKRGMSASEVEAIDRRNGVLGREKTAEYRESSSKKNSSRLFGNRSDKNDGEMEEETPASQASSKMTMSSPRPIQRSIPERKNEDDDVPPAPAKMTMSSPRPPQKPIAPVKRDEDEDDVPQTGSRMTMSSPRPPQRPIAPVKRDEDEDDVPQTGSRMTMSSPRPPQRPIAPVKRDEDEDDVPQTGSRMTMSSPRPPQRPIAPVKRDEDEDDTPQTGSRMTMSSPRPPQRPIAPVKREEDEDDTPQTGSRMTMSSPRPPQRPIAPIKREEDDTPQTGSRMTMSSPRPPQRPVTSVKREEEDEVPKTSSKMTIGKAAKGLLFGKKQQQQQDADDVEPTASKISMSSPRPPRSTFFDTKKKDAEEIAPTASGMTMASPRPPQRPIPAARKDDDEDDVPQTSSRMSMSSPRPPQRPIPAVRADEDEDAQQTSSRMASAVPRPAGGLRRDEEQAESITRGSTSSVRAQMPSLRTPARPVISRDEDSVREEKPALRQEEPVQIQQEKPVGTEPAEAKPVEEKPAEAKPETVVLSDEEKEAIKKKLVDEYTNELRSNLSLKEEVGSKFREDLREELRPELEKEVSDALRTELQDGLKAEVTQSLRNELQDGLKAEVTQSLRNELQDGLKAEVTQSLRNELQDGLKAEVTQSLRNELQDGLKGEVAETLRGEFRESLKDGIAKEIRDELHEGLKEEVGSKLREDLREELRPELEKEVSDALRTELQDGLKAEVTQSLRNELQDGLKGEVTETLRGELRESLKDGVTKEIRDELHEGLKEEVAKSLREELHDNLKGEVSDSLRSEFRVSLKDEVTKEIRDELHEGLKEEVAKLLREEIRKSMLDEIRAEIKSEIKEETKDEVAKVVMAEEVEAARIRREKEEARQDAEREKRDAQEQARREEELRREEERLKLEEAKNVAELRAEEERARQEEVRLQLETEELREKAKMRRIKEYEGKGKKLLVILIPAILGVISLALVIIFAGPVSKGLYGARNGIDRFLFYKAPGVAKALGITNGDKVVLQPVSLTKEEGTKLLADPEDYVRSASPALGFTASLRELNGLTCLCMEGEGVRVYYPTELTKSGMKYVYVENDTTFSMNFWEYDFSNPASLCPKKEVHNSEGREQYVFTYFFPEKTIHLLDVQTLKENELVPADDVIRQLVDRSDCREEDGKVVLKVTSGSISYTYNLPLPDTFLAENYELKTDVDAAYKLGEKGYTFESYVTANDVYIGKIVGEYEFQSRIYVPGKFTYYAFSDRAEAVEGQYVFTGASKEDAMKERVRKTGVNGEQILVPAGK